MQGKRAAGDVVASQKANSASWRDIFALMVPGVFSVASIICQVSFTANGERGSLCYLKHMLQWCCITLQALLSPQMTTAARRCRSCCFTRGHRLHRQSRSLPSVSEVAGFQNRIPAGFWAAVHQRQPVIDALWLVHHFHRHCQRLAPQAPSQPPAPLR